MSALIVAIRNGQYETVNVLIECGANVNVECVIEPTKMGQIVMPLMVASDKRMVELLLKHGAKINKQSKEKGWTALMFASDEGKTETATLLLEYGADVEIQGFEKPAHKESDEKLTLTALMIASRRGYTEIVQLLLEYKAVINMQNNEGWTALMFACDNGHTETATLLLEHGADVDIQGNERPHSYSPSALTAATHMNTSGKNDEKFTLTALMRASKHGCAKFVQLLLEYKASINMQNNRGWTALMFASDEKHTEAATLLLEHGADADIQGYKTTEVNIYKRVLTRREYIFQGGHMTALMIASQHGNEEIVELLLKHGAKVNVQSKDIGWTALMFASDSGHTIIATLFLKHGADVDVLGVGNGQEFTALMIASKHGDDEIAKLLLKYEANINLQNNQGMSALMIAAVNRFYSLSELLLSYNADINLQNKEGMSAVMIASQQGDFKTVLLLLKYGADMGMEGNRGMSASSMAKKVEMSKIIETLEQEQRFGRFSQPYHRINLGIIILILHLSVCVYERKGHRKLFDPSLKSRFLCIATLRRYKSSRLKQLATALAKY